MMATKEITKAQNLANARAQGASIKRVGLIMNLIVAAVIGAAIFGAYSVYSLIRAEARVPAKVTQE